MLSKLPRKILHSFTRNGVPALASRRFFNPETHRVVPKNSSVYDPNIFGKFDLQTQEVVPKDQADLATYNFDTMLQFAQRHRSDGRSPLVDNRVAISLKFVPQGSGIFLDAAAAHVNESVKSLAEESGYQYLPIDINGDGEKVRREDLCNLTLEDESVSLIFSVDTLEHIQDVNTAIANMYRVLRTDGVAIIHVPAYFFARKDSPDIDVANDPYGHVRYFSGPDLVERLFTSGFIPLRINFNLDYGAAIVCAAKNPDLWKGRTSLS